MRMRANPRDTLNEYNFLVHQGWKDPRTLMHIYLVTSPAGEPGVVFFHYGSDGRAKEAVFYGINGGGNSIDDMPSWIPFARANPVEKPGISIYWAAKSKKAGPVILTFPATLTLSASGPENAPGKKYRSWERAEFVTADYRLAAQQAQEALRLMKKKPLKIEIIGLNLMRTAIDPSYIAAVASSGGSQSASKRDVPDSVWLLLKNL